MPPLSRLVYKVCIVQYKGSDFAFVLQNMDQILNISKTARFQDRFDCRKMVGVVLQFYMQFENIITQPIVKQSCQDILLVSVIIILSL